VRDRGYCHERKIQPEVSYPRTTTATFKLFSAVAPHACGECPTVLSLARVYHSFVTRFIRPVAVLLTLVLLQLVLVESGYACRMSSNDQSRDSSMAGMQMAGSSPESPAPAEQHQQQAPCRFPWAPSGCQSMVPCAPSALAIVATAETEPAPPRAAAPELVLLAPLSLDRAPELPPPRA
jgi:hypothetical protein